MLVLLVLAFFLGGGWYFAGQIEASGLRVEDPAPSYDLEVTAISRDTITIADPGDTEPVLAGDAYWGIEWDGGYGQVYGPGTGEDEVTKSFLLWSGRGRPWAPGWRSTVLPSPPPSRAWRWTVR